MTQVGDNRLLMNVGDTVSTRQAIQMGETQVSDGVPR